MQKKVFPHLRFGKAVVDYYLSRIVFPKEMKEFPSKLSASGWDIGQVKAHPTTGFSGTNDSRNALPISVQHVDLESQRHTNAFVLNNLLRDENLVHLMPPRGKTRSSYAELLIDKVIHMYPQPRVILDPGAQVLELDNLGMAKALLASARNKNTQAVVYFNEFDELSVLDDKGNVEPLQTSPFAKQLEKYLVFLDEVHTRGTDLQLPPDYRALVTLGAHLTKDKLVQGWSSSSFRYPGNIALTKLARIACMRMRKLGKGQSVVFCVPEEVQVKIRELTRKPDGEISVSDILTWSISETWNDLRRNMPLWVLQGDRFDRQSNLWAEAKTTDGTLMSAAHAEKFLDPEAQTLEKRYRPRPDSQGLAELECLEAPRSDTIKRIAARYREFEGASNFTSGVFQEEQERELCPELEEEREIERPADAEPANHVVHPHVTAFVVTGLLKQPSPAFKPAFLALNCTTAASHAQLDEFPKDLLVTADYARTIQTRASKSGSDDYIRPVQWILTGLCHAKKNTVKHMVIISPYEAQSLLPLVKSSQMGVSLHLYSPRINMVVRPIDHLQLYTVPERRCLKIDSKFTVLLNLFSGQLCLSSFVQYVRLCDTLGLAWEATGGDITVAATWPAPSSRAPSPS